MRYLRTASFKADYSRLGRAEQEAFRAAVRSFNEACDRFVADRDPSVWPASLRVKPVKGVPGVWEITWSFAGPDGRATWEWAQVDGKPAVRWRRIGDHRIFRRP